VEYWDVEGENGVHEAARQLGWMDSIKLLATRQLVCKRPLPANGFVLTDQVFNRVTRRRFATNKTHVTVLYCLLSTSLSLNTMHLHCTEWRIKISKTI